MASKSATLLVVFVVAIIAFCIASVFAAMTGEINILPNNETNLLNLSDNNTSDTSINTQSYDTSGSSDSSSYSSSSDSSSSSSSSQSYDSGSHESSSPSQDYSQGGGSDEPVIDEGSSENSNQK